MPAQDESAIIDIADALFRAIEHSDVAKLEELFNDDILVWHSGDTADSERARALRVINWFINHTTYRRYEILDRQIFESGFVQQHLLHATGTNGTVLAMRVCIVIKLATNGLINRIDEYFDPQDMAPIL